MERSDSTPTVRGKHRQRDLTSPGRAGPNLWSRRSGFLVGRPGFLVADPEIPGQGTGNFLVVTSKFLVKNQEFLVKNQREDET